MPYRAVIFDLDGTLIDSERHNLVAWKAACARYGYELTEEFYHSLVGLGRATTDHRFREQFAGCDVGLLRQARREIFFHAWDNGSPVPRKHGLDDLLAWLDQRGILQAVATSSARVEAEAKLTRAALRFPVVVCGDEVPVGKPDPDIFLEAARQVGVPPGECLVVEDSPYGVVGAVRAGMDVVFIPDLLVADEETARLARVLGSLAEVPQLFARS